MATFLDHYAVLGIEPTANTNEIKRAYRQLALKHHPDKAAPGSKPDSSKFIGVLAAYEILVDDSKRKAYDLQCKNPSNSTATHQETRSRKTRQQETSGGFSTGFWSYPERNDEGPNMPGAFPSDDDDSNEHDDEYEDTGVWEEPFADPQYTSCYAGDFRYDNSGLYTEDFDATDSRHQFPDEFADEAYSPAQGYDNESVSEGEHHRDDENTAPRISDPISEAFDILADILASQHLGEKVRGRYYQSALDELRLQRGRCNEIDTQINDIAARLRRRVGKMPAGSVPLQEFDKSLKQRMNTAHRAIRVAQLKIEAAIFVMRNEQKPGSWKATNMTTRGIIIRIEESAGDLAQMKRGLSGLDYIVGKMEWWTNSDMRQLNECLLSFMSELRDWGEEAVSR